MSATIEVRGLTKSYGSVRAVDGVTFSVATGDIIGVLGPNGAGKTTMIEILEGYRRGDAGTVTVLGEDPATAGRGWRDRLGVVLQTSAVEDELTVREAIDHLARFYSSPRPTDEAVALAGLQEKADARIKTLSGGQRRRLDLALGIIGRPELLFLDEPTTGFDPAARRAAWETISGLGHDGTTIVLTTHYLEEARFLANRVIVLSDGRIVADGDPDTLGGRHERVATIRFRTADGVTAPEDARSVDGGWEIETVDPVPVLHRLTAWSLEESIPLDALEVTRPSLEDVYLELVEEVSS